MPPNTRQRQPVLSLRETPDSRGKPCPPPTHTHGARTPDGVPPWRRIATAGQVNRPLTRMIGGARPAGCECGIRPAPRREPCPASRQRHGRLAAPRVRYLAGGRADDGRGWTARTGPAGKSPEKPGWVSSLSATAGRVCRPAGISVIAAITAAVTALSWRCHGTDTRASMTLSAAPVERGATHCRIMRRYRLGLPSLRC